MPYCSEQGFETYSVSLRGTAGTQMTEETSKRGSVLMSEHVSNRPLHNFSIGYESMLDLRSRDKCVPLLILDIYKKSSSLGGRPTIVH
jgi:hypothetical protein